jgi:hypothetical protein
MTGSTHTASGSYERIARKLFQETQYDAFYLEYDTERAGGFEPLRFLLREERCTGCCLNENGRIGGYRHVGR